MFASITSGVTEDVAVGMEVSRVGTWGFTGAVGVIGMGSAVEDSGVAEGSWVVMDVASPVLVVEAGSVSVGEDASVLESTSVAVSVADDSRIEEKSLALGTPDSVVVPVASPSVAVSVPGETVFVTVTVGPLSSSPVLVVEVSPPRLVPGTVGRSTSEEGVSLGDSFVDVASELGASEETGSESACVELGSAVVLSAGAVDSGLCRVPVTSAVVLSPCPSGVEETSGVSFAGGSGMMVLNVGAGGSSGFLNTRVSKFRLLAGYDMGDTHAWGSVMPAKSESSPSSFTKPRPEPRSSPSTSSLPSPPP